MKIKFWYLIVFTLVIGACNQKTTTVTKKSNAGIAESFTLTGKKAKLVYPEFQAEVNYISDDEIHWKTLDKSGKKAEGDEKISLKKIRDRLFFVNWIEKDGTTVSQVIDAQKGTVQVYLTYTDDKSNRANRSSVFMEGKWQELK